jgi:hypothetical protein
MFKQDDAVSLFVPYGHDISNDTYVSENMSNHELGDTFDVRPSPTAEVCRLSGLTRCSLRVYITV